MDKIKVEKLVPGGQGIGTLADGKKIFLWNVLPGEVVEEYEVTKKKSSYVEAVATKIIEKSEHRVEPKDACFLSTSPWQMMDFDFELKMKAELVQEVFRQNGIILGAPEVVTDGKAWQYRNKMEYALYFDKESEQIELAFHARGSHRKVPIECSSIERAEILARAREIVADLNARGEEARKYQSLLLRCNADGVVSGGLYENGQPHPAFENLSDKILGQEYTYSPNGFFQINLPVYELALQEMKKYIVSEKVLDLYSGVGTIGLSIARNKELVLVENNKFAFLELQKNCNIEPNEDTSCGRSSLPSSRGSSLRPRRDCGCPQEVPSSGSPRAFLCNSEDALEYIAPDQTVIVDPPRAGCDKKLIEKLIEVHPKKIIYLSCNPATQARDVAMLKDAYEIEAVKTFNFFPRTPHIENLIILR